MSLDDLRFVFLPGLTSIITFTFYTYVYAGTRVKNCDIFEQLTNYTIIMVSMLLKLQLYRKLGRGLAEILIPVPLYC